MDKTLDKTLVCKEKFGKYKKESFFMFVTNFLSMRPTNII